MTRLPPSLRPSLSLALALVLMPGCRACEGGSGRQVEEVATPRPPKKQRATGDVARKSLVAVTRRNLKSLQMSILDAPEAERSLAAEVAAARALVEKKEPGAASEARTILGSWIEANPTDADAHYWFGRSWQLERIQVPSIDSFERALSHDAELVAARRWLAQSMFVENRCSDALPHLTMLVDAQPEAGSVYADRAVCHIALDDWDAALVDLSKSCTLGEAPYCTDVRRLEAVEARASTGGVEKTIDRTAFRSKLGKGKGKRRAGKLGKGKFKGKGGRLRGKLGGRTPDATPTHEEAAPEEAAPATTEE